ncbi:MAG: hypothetical protein ABIN61_04830 [candidate division WOR-3 bacterium]
MKIMKIVLILFGSIVLLAGVVFGIYLLCNIQDVAKPFELGSQEAETKILIASQGSEYKNLLVDTLTTRLRNKNFYVKVIDISSLKEIHQEEWDFEILIHTTEAWRVPEPVREFLGRVKNPNEVILVITSGVGSWKPEGFNVEMITSASKTFDIPEISNKIMDRINSLLNK